MAETETQKKVSLLFERDGYKTPILRMKKGETETDFVERMTKAGYTNLKEVGFHLRPDSNDVHVGPLDGCKYCARAAKRKEVKVPTQTTKPDAISDDASTAPEETVIDKAADATPDDDPKQSEHVSLVPHDQAVEEAAIIQEEEKAEPEDPAPVVKRKRGRPRKDAK
jgi:hypothetical protein